MPTRVFADDDADFVAEFDSFRKASAAEAEAATEAIEALENQVSLTARENARLKAQLDRAQKQIDTLSAKLDARSSNGISDSGVREEVYQDLTGLVISRVERSHGEATLHCVQTGRNGTIHYTLAWPREDREAQIVYTPQLDDADGTGRDHDLRDILPEYLATQIMFKQDQASLFAYRLWTAMQKRQDV
ncbi:hypothetical protein PYCC9005_000757 [Savitreella phatthalungensis]